MQAIVRGTRFRDITFQPNGFNGKPAFRIKVDDCAILTDKGSRKHEQVLVIIPAFGNEDALTNLLGEAVLQYRMWIKEHER
ncbi:MAG: hypothetical protein UT24_C0003G0023 [Candidatus Woesebacteria bacterium GW2011_GWB1_39_12]|uniref:Uncharacterized protein n=1 Tax=Candidatus Woesebacteria bacterium GW2011_GWB1_39_12 TaxID=1618574 RepID=A0A0G0MMI9_9BACT|nr:MAG: hypothetical protein UT24_C0003G0023 [Candidatus Woesebacteria bacterium GW2011_GWB1_39_12]